MTRVWAGSRAKGSDLLVLLAIADYARDDGTGAWPSIERLAAKARLSERNIRYIVRRLAAFGELSITPKAGPYGANLYRVHFQEPDDEGGKLCPLPAEEAPDTDPSCGNVAPSCGNPASFMRQPVAPDPLDPSLDPSSLFLKQERGIGGYGGKGAKRRERGPPGSAAAGSRNGTGTGAAWTSDRHTPASPRRGGTSSAAARRGGSGRS